MECSNHKGQMVAVDIPDRCSRSSQQLQRPLAEKRLNNFFSNVSNLYYGLISSGRINKCCSTTKIRLTYTTICNGMSSIWVLWANVLNGAIQLLTL